MSPTLAPAGWDSRVSSVRTTDVDLVRLVVETYFYAHHLNLLRPSRGLDTRLDVLQFGPLAVGDVTFGGDIALRTGEIGAYHVDLMVSGQIALRQGNQAFGATTRLGAVLLPVGDIAADKVSADSRILALKIDRAALERHIEALIDGPVSSPVWISPTFDVSREPGRAWAALVRLLADEITNDAGLVYQPMVAERLCEAIITGLLLVTDHPYREALERPGPKPAPSAVRRAMDAIHAHPEAAYTARRLAEIAGVSIRSLQEGFRRHVGTTPLSYLRSVRLERAHEDLLRADPRNSTVADVAHRWGFVHQSRFAAAYRARYHASPSQALRRSDSAPVLAG
jgi:AraC-like DNA-binding protein